jgi:SPP1 family predicted phage head-tail adaptor
MSFGKMNAFIDIVQNLPTKDAAGFATTQDTVLKSVRAYREDRHGTETWANRAAFSSATTLFRFRVIPDLAITTKQFIICDGTRFNITSEEDIKNRGMYIEVLAEKVEASS